MIKNLGQVCLFSSLITILVEQCEFWDNVGIVGVACFTSFKAVIYWGMSKIAKGNVCQKGYNKGIRTHCSIFGIVKQGLVFM